MKAAAPHACEYSTRRKRRAAVAHIVAQLDCIAAAEETYRDNIPLYLLGSDLYDAAEYRICLLDEAAEILRSIYD
jgi:hypothetical protein